MKMYVGNATKQYHDFIYRLPESVAPLRQQIAPGGQVQLSGDLSPHAIEGVIEQHTKYGLIRVDQIDRAKPFSGLCYSLDKPVSAEKLLGLVHHNDRVLVERGRKIREEAALATNSAVEAQLEDRSLTDNLTNFEMSAVEETRDPKDESPVFAEGVRVTRGQNPEENQPQRRGRPRKSS